MMNAYETVKAALVNSGLDNQTCVDALVALEEVRKCDGLRADLNLVQEQLASSTDLANTWAREKGIPEAKTEMSLHRLIDDLWNVTSSEFYQTDFAATIERAEKAEAELKSLHKAFAESIEARTR